MPYSPAALPSYPLLPLNKGLVEKGGAAKNLTEKSGGPYPHFRGKTVDLLVGLSGAGSGAGGGRETTKETLATSGVALG